MYSMYLRIFITEYFMSLKAQIITKGIYQYYFTVYLTQKHMCLMTCLQSIAVTTIHMHVHMYSYQTINVKRVCACGILIF